ISEVEKLLDARRRVPVASARRDLVETIEEPRAHVARFRRHLASPRGALEAPHDREGEQSPAIGAIENELAEAARRLVPLELAVLRLAPRDRVRAEELAQNDEVDAVGHAIGDPGRAARLEGNRARHAPS